MVNLNVSCHHIFLNHAHHNLTQNTQNIEVKLHEFENEKYLYT